MDDSRNRAVTPSVAEADVIPPYGSPDFEPVSLHDCLAHVAAMGGFGDHYDIALVERARKSRAVLTRTASRWS